MLLVGKCPNELFPCRSCHGGAKGLRSSVLSRGVTAGSALERGSVRGGESQTPHPIQINFIAEEVTVQVGLPIPQ